MERLSGEQWFNFEEVAARLKVPPEALYLRFARGWLKTRQIAPAGGTHKPHIHEAEVERLKRDGLPHPLLEGHLAGDFAPIPDEWLTVTRSKNAYGPSGFIALKPMLFGPNRRQMLPGDIFGANDGIVTDLQLAHGDVAELPLRHGVLAIIRAAQARIEQLEGQLADAKAKA